VASIQFDEEGGGKKSPGRWRRTGPGASAGPFGEMCPVEIAEEMQILDGDWAIAHEFG
jgi:hypothetical protein